jgi:HSP20 family protein
MHAAMEPRHGTMSLPDLFDWIVPDFPAMPGLRGAHGIRIEESVSDGVFTLRAELPGIDPEQDVEISVEGDMLSIRAERTTKTEDKRHSEFHYGALARTVRLPAGARTGEAEADYKDGILTVTVPVPEETGQGPRTIAVQRPEP